MKRYCIFFISVVWAFALPHNINELREMYLGSPKNWTLPLVDSGVEWSEIAPLPLTPPYPESNPFSEEKRALGEKLFHDPKLSLSGQIACASCHDRELGYGDGRKLSYGHDRQTGRRNAPSVVMSAFGEEKFWDGRAKSLEIQSLMPIIDQKEMANSLSNVLEYVALQYKDDFESVFGTEATLENVAKALATFQRSLMPRNSRFDRFMRGDSAAFNDMEVWGLDIFRTKARCMNCHHGVAFSDYKYHNLGLTYYGRKYEDLGRYEVTHNPSDVGAFKTPSLRQVSYTAPYMHNGLFPHLRGILRAYNSGMFDVEPSSAQKDDPLFPTKSHLLHKLDLSNEELEALEAFLRTL